MLYHILRLEKRISRNYSWSFRSFSTQAFLWSSEQGEYSVNNAILSLVPIGAPHLCLEVTPLSKRWQTGFLSQAECHVPAQGSFWWGLHPDFSRRDVLLWPLPTLAGWGSETAHLQLCHFSGRKKGRRHQKPPELIHRRGAPRAGPCWYEGWWYLSIHPARFATPK